LLTLGLAERGGGAQLLAALPAAVEEVGEQGWPDSPGAHLAPSFAWSPTPHPVFFAFIDDGPSNAMTGENP